MENVNQISDKAFKDFIESKRELDNMIQFVGEHFECSIPRPTQEISDKYRIRNTHGSIMVWHVLEEFFKNHTLCDEKGNFLPKEKA